ncbi:MAG TPA: zinc ribbon domain-containing protein [Blastocatellia bacterium]|nr:zinc ribbon domain-containing protein [Blastocatellia bacterium]
MFCPRCAVENQNETRFCRSCGTDLEVVAQALSTGTISTEFITTGETRVELVQKRIQLQADGLRRVLQGTLLFVAGILLGIPLYLFSEHADWHSNWILIWLIFCGWIPVWGAFMIGTGLSNLIQSRMTQQTLDWLFPQITSLSSQQSEQTRRIDEVARVRSDSVDTTDRTTGSMNHS